jgi:hypothetical protein
MRATNVQFPTKLSAGLLPPLRQTASYRLAFFINLSVEFHAFGTVSHIAPPHFERTKISNYYHIFTNS